MVGYGQGVGAPAAFIFATIVLVVFSVGYVAMARRRSPRVASTPTSAAFWSWVGFEMAPRDIDPDVAHSERQSPAHTASGRPRYAHLAPRYSSLEEIPVVARISAFRSNY